MHHDFLKDLDDLYERALDNNKISTALDIKKFLFKVSNKKPCDVVDFFKRLGAKDVERLIEYIQNQEVLNKKREGHMKQNAQKG